MDIAITVEELDVFLFSTESLRVATSGWGGALVYKGKHVEYKPQYHQGFEHESHGTLNTFYSCCSEFTNGHGHHIRIFEPRRSTECSLVSKDHFHAVRSFTSFLSR